MPSSQVKLGAPGPLSLLMPGADDPQGSGALDQALSQLTSSVQQSPEDRWRDEQLAFAGGMTDPSGNGSFGGAMTSAFKAQGNQRLKERELQLMYMPAVVNALAQQEQLRQQRLQQQQMLKMLSGASGPQGGESWVQGLSSKFGLPAEFVISDLAFNQGKGIAEKIYKQGTPDIAFEGGVAFDKNKLGKGAGDNGVLGFVPSVSTAANGQTTVRMPGADGQLRVFAPPGALDTYRQFTDTSNRSAADFVPDEVTPRGQAPQLVTRAQKSDLARAASRGAGASYNPTTPPGAFDGLPAPEPGLTGSFQGDPAQVLRSIADIRDPQERANALQAYTSQTTQAAAQGQTARLEADMRAAQDRGDIAEAQRLRGLLEQSRQPQGTVGLELKSPAEAKREELAVDAEGKKYVSDAGELRKAKVAVGQLEQAIRLMETGSPTASGLGSMRDAAYAFVGKESDPAAQARALSTIQGWLTSNVPRMEGPQSNFDVMNYQQMTGMVGNEKLPIRTRLAAAKAALGLIKDAAPRTFGQAWEASGAGQIPTATPFQVSPDIIKAERQRRQAAKEQR